MYVDNGNIEHNEGDIGLTTDLESAIDRGDPIEISSLVDESSFIDYVIFQDYIGNIDWPHNNIRMYSVSGAPFRFVLYDLDHASEKTKNPETAILHTHSKRQFFTHRRFCVQRGLWLEICSISNKFCLLSVLRFTSQTTATQNDA